MDEGGVGNLIRNKNTGDGCAFLAGRLLELELVVKKKHLFKKKTSSIC